MIKQLTTLGHEHRLSVFRLLMRRYPDKVPAGEISNALGIKPSTMSTYLSALQRADLVTQDRIGTSLLYGANMPAVTGLLSALAGDCCQGRIGMCDVGKTLSGATAPPYNVLFLCNGNSARSIFAEGLLRHMDGARFNVYSAGTHPQTAPNATALTILRERGIDVSDLRSKPISEYTTPESPQFDFVFTVCDSAANEGYPSWDPLPVHGHWGVPDPVSMEPPDGQKREVFEKIFESLEERIASFVALHIEQLSRIERQSAIDQISKTPVPEIT